MIQRRIRNISLQIIGNAISIFSSKTWRLSRHPQKELGVEPEIETMRRAVAAAFDEVTLAAPSKKQLRKALLAKIDHLGVESRVGWITHAGRTSTREGQVQFNVNGTDAWSSRWLDWAFESARDGLLHGKKVWVISSGAPFGKNLLQVLVLNRPV